MGKKSDGALTSRKTTCDFDMFFANENVNLKMKNSELAKSLAESRMAYTEVVAQKDMLQRDLFNECTKNNKLVNYIKLIDAKSKSAINMLLEITNEISQIMETTASAINYVQSVKDNVNMNQENVSTSSPSKTQAVKPMIDGHVILRPTVKLTRVPMLSNLRHSISNINVQNGPTESAENEGQNNMSTNSSHSLQNDSNEEIGTSSLNELSLNNEENSINEENSSQSYIDSNLEDGRLNTLRETDEDSSGAAGVSSTLVSNPESINITGATTPILSGIFKEVRVYLSRDDDASAYFSNFTNSTKNIIPKFSRASSTNVVGSSNSQYQVKNDEIIDNSASNNIMVKSQPEVLNESPQSSSRNHSLTDYDPLEGPSTLLNDIRKINALRKLGLEPLRSFNSSTPNDEINHNTSGFVTLRKKALSMKLRSPSLQKRFSSPRQNSFRRSSGSLNLNGSETRRTSELNNTPRSSLGKKSFSSPSPKRKFINNPRIEQFKPSLSEYEKQPKMSKKSVKKKVQNSRKLLKKGSSKRSQLSPDACRKSPRELKTAKKKIHDILTKRKANDDVKVKEEISSANDTSKSDETDDSSASNGYPRRHRKPVKCLAEPSLRKKLRRS